MNKSISLFSLVLILLLSLSACEECYDCGPDDAYPYFKLTILNRTSLDTLQVNINRITKEIKALEAAIAAAENATIEVSLKSKKAIKADSLAYFNSIIKTVNSKLLSIRSINGVENLYYSNLSKSDSVKSFKVPLDLNNNSAEYAIIISGRQAIDSLRVSYELIDTVLNKRITKAATGLKVISHNYDSIRGPYGCPKSSCISNLQTVYVEI